MAVPYPVPARHSPSRPSILHTTSWCNKGPFRPRRVWRVWSFGRRTRPESLPRPPKRPAKAANKACWALFFVPLARFLPLLPSRSVDGCCSGSGWVVPSHGALSIQPDPTIRCPPWTHYPSRQCGHRGLVDSVHVVSVQRQCWRYHPAVWLYVDIAHMYGRKSAAQRLLWLSVWALRHQIHCCLSRRAEVALLTNWEQVQPGTARVLLSSYNRCSSAAIAP